MRVRLLRNVRMAGSSSVELLAGSVVNTTPDVAEKWQKQGIAMEDKSMDGGSELKEPRPKPETTAPPPLRVPPTKPHPSKRSSRRVVKRG